MFITIFIFGDCEPPCPSEARNEVKSKGGPTDCSFFVSLLNFFIPCIK